MNETTYQELFEKYSKRDQVRSVVTLVSAAVGVTAAILRLRELRADRRAVQDAVTRGAR